MTPEKYRCPVCNAPFRQTDECSRCGADLRPLINILLASYRRRQAARNALRTSDSVRAGALIREAQALQDTRQGRQLALLAQWLDRCDLR